MGINKNTAFLVLTIIPWCTAPCFAASPDAPICTDEPASSVMDPTRAPIPDLKPNGPVAKAITEKVVEATKEKWPKGCLAAPAVEIRPYEKKFCLGFAADYFYRLHFTEEKLVYEGSAHQQTYDRPKFSVRGALFLLAQAENESEWGKSDPAKFKHNYWGLSAGVQRALGFPRFEEGFRFFMNHLERGISYSGGDIGNHPGWPKFLELMQKDDFTTVEANKALNSGPQCGRFPPYNNGRPDSCAESRLGKQCPCIDYAGIIMRVTLPKLISSCLAVYQSDPNAEAKSDIYTEDPSAEATPAKRRSLAYQEMLKYARGLCEQ